MYIVNLINQIGNFFENIWSNNSLKKIIIYSIVFFMIAWYSTRTLNSMIRRDRIELPAVAEQVISAIYAKENEAYAERVRARAAQQQANVQQRNGQTGGQQANVQQQPQQQQQQQAQNRGGNKTSYRPINAIVIIMQLISMSAICCTIIFLVYRRFTKDTVPPLPILSSKGKLNEEL